MTTTTTNPARLTTGRAGFPSGWAGTGRLVRFHLRRDRVLLPIWMFTTLGLLASVVASAAQTYPTVQDRQDRFDQLQALPMFLLFQGKAFDSSLAALTVQQGFGGTTLLAGIGAALLVIRHTRTEEQHGRSELLGSTAVGRRAPLVAAVAVVLAAGVCVGMLASLELIVLGLPPVGSVLFGCVVTGASWVGVAVAALYAQVVAHARLAGTLSLVTVLGLHYLRGIGHVAGEGAGWVTWLSPSGWLEGVEAYAGNRGWPLLLVLAWVFGVLALALHLSARRDLGSSLVAARPGRRNAPRSLSGMVGLTWRQSRVGFTVWALAFAVIGMVFGGAGAAAVDDYADAPWLAEYSAALGIADPAQTFFVYVIFVMVFPVVAYGILTVLRIRNEEVSGIAEITLAKPVGRLAWVAGPIGAALAGSAALLIILGVMLAVTAPEVPGVLPLTLTLIPAVWVIIAVTVLAIGVLARAATVIAWAAMVIGIVGEFGVKAGLPDWVYLATSPIAHVNPYYATPYGPFVLLGVAALLLALGLVALRRRDLSS